MSPRPCILALPASIRATWPRAWPRWTITERRTIGCFGWWRIRWRPCACATIWATTWCARSRIHECVSRIRRALQTIPGRRRVAWHSDGDKNVGYYGAYVLWVPFTPCNLDHAGLEFRRSRRRRRQGRPRDRGRLVVSGYDDASNRGLPDLHSGPLQLRYAVFQSGGHSRSKFIEDREGFAAERQGVRGAAMVTSVDQKMVTDVAAAPSDRRAASARARRAARYGRLHGGGLARQQRNGALGQPARQWWRPSRGGDFLCLERLSRSAPSILTSRSPCKCVGLCGAPRGACSARVLCGAYSGPGPAWVIRSHGLEFPTSTLSRGTISLALRSFVGRLACLWTIPVEMHFYLVFVAAWWVYSRLPVAMVVAAVRRDCPLLEPACPGAGRGTHFTLLSGVFPDRLADQPRHRPARSARIRRSVCLAHRGFDLPFPLYPNIYAALFGRSGWLLNGRPPADVARPAIPDRCRALSACGALFSSYQGRTVREGNDVPGKISYSVYLLHFPVIDVLARFMSLAKPSNVVPGWQHR